MLDSESQRTTLGATRRQIREFSIAWLIFFTALGARHWFLHRDVDGLVVYAAIALSVGLGGIVKPSLVNPLFTLAMTVSAPLGLLMTRSVLGLLFYGMFTPVGWFFRRIGRDPLRISKPKVTSYWTDAPAPTNARSSFRQSS